MVSHVRGGGGGPRGGAPNCPRDGSLWEPGGGGGGPCGTSVPGGGGGGGGVCCHPCWPSGLAPGCLGLGVPGPCGLKCPGDNCGSCGLHALWYGLGGWGGR